MTFLEKILAEKEKEVARLKASQLRLAAIDRKAPSLYETFMQSERMSIISEIKRASPSKGDIRTEIDPVHQAIQYEEAGANAISVLTDQPFFKGTIDDLKAVSQAVKLPVLCKDFIIDEIQIDIAKANGASVILLIAAALNSKRLKQLYDYAQSKNLEVLLEVHNEEELQVALAVGANIIGINNRNLKTFEVDLAVVEHLAKQISDPNILIISESGIRTREDVVRVQKAGAKGILVGETLMRSTTVKEAIKSLVGETLHKVKICGIQTLEAAQAAVQAGADLIGFVFADSKRYIEPEKAAMISASIPANVQKVGVFVNEEVNRMKAIAEQVGLDYIQLHGDELQDVIDQLNYPVIKSFPIQTQADLEKINQYKADIYLLDSAGGPYRGGNGISINWELLTALSTKENVMLAGGLTAQNVADAIAMVKPMAVDVSSGVETNGEKDKEKMMQFISQAKQAFQKLEESECNDNLYTTEPNGSLR